MICRRYHDLAADYAAGKFPLLVSMDNQEQRS